MLNQINIIKAVLICAIINITYTFYVSTNVFQQQLAANGQEVGRIKAFMITTQQTDGFWFHIFKAWGTGFGIALISCLLLLFWMKKQTPNQSLKIDAQKTRAF